MAYGWVSIHRSILDNSLWTKERFTRGQAWVDLILNANHKENTVWIKGSTIQVKRGEQIRSKVTLSKTWGWNERTVTKFLKTLENEGMITQKSTNQTTHITICKYNDFQDVSVNSTEQSTEQHTSRVQSRVQTNNNVNNGNKVNNKDYGAKAPPKNAFTPPNINQVNEYLLERNASEVDGQQFIDHHQARGWVLSNRQKMKDWKAGLRTWIANDKKFNNRGNNGNRKQSFVDRVESANREQATPISDITAYCKIVD